MADHLLAAVDGSVEGIAAARWAADEATRYGLPLRLVHAQTWLDGLHADSGQPTDVRALTTRMLADAKRAVEDTHPGLEIRAESIGGGEPVEVLVDAASGARMLALGSRGSAASADSWSAPSAWPSPPAARSRPCWSAPAGPTAAQGPTDPRSSSA
ncbi:universal stress protein [Kitasatospora sp. NBC_01246]|uniref:universal stress protein n=1 Tax=Kitasatospora sp. NBC_01246 TaxID=2903570 RepID=UPI002E30B4FC|nr:universal stress protein [Kitasatospora sp. NBC_01246]